MPTVPETPELLAYLRECGIDFSTGKPIEPEPEPGIPADIGEKDFQTKVMRFAEDHGWTVYHVLRSRGSLAGFPDLHLFRGPQYMVAELKTAKGKVTPEQKKFLNRYRKASIAAHVWRPSDWDQIKRVLGEVR